MVRKIDDENQRRDETLSLLYVLVTALNDAFGFEEQVAMAMAEPIAEAMRRNYPATRVYIPSQDIEERNREIRRMHNGLNNDYIMSRYGIGKTTLYRILGEK